MNWYIRRMEPRDTGAFLDFLSLWIKHVPVISHYKWLYRENPHGEALTWLAIDSKSEHIIGCTSGFPRKVWVRNRIVLGCLGGDTLVDSQFRGRGIAKEIHRVSLGEMTEAGIKFLYGFPNPANLNAFLKAGAYQPGRFNIMKYLLRIEPLIRKLNCGRTLSTKLSNLGNKVLSSYINFKLAKSAGHDCNLKIISEFDNRIEKLIEEVVPSFNICCVRGRDYLNWRYFRHPLRTHTILSYEEDGYIHGFAAINFSGNNCTLFDFFVRNDDKIVQKIIYSIIRFAALKLSHLITVMVNPRGPYIRAFRECGFKFWFPAEELPLMVLIKRDDGDAKYMNQIENWYLTNGDSD